MQSAREWNDQGEQTGVAPRAASIVSDLALLRRSLAEADPVTLLLVLVHLTGEPRWLAEAKPYVSGPMSYQASLPPEVVAHIHDALVETLVDYARAQRPWPQMPSGDLLVQLMESGAGSAVGSDYVEMMRSDLDPSHSPPIELGRLPLDARSAPADLDVIVIGAGMSGIAAAIYLKAAGTPFTVIEKGASFGGTWRQNVYPGCGVDTPNHFYSYSFEPENNWSHFFAKRDELWAYFEAVAARHGLAEHTRFGVEVLSATFDATSKRWILNLRGPQGEQQLTARAVISAVGILDRPKWPDIQGLDAFSGDLLHSGEWDPGFDWRGKRIALIGTGASAHQIAPTIAADVEHLSIFQRSPHWVVPNPNYFLEVAPGKKWVLANIPFYARWYRFQLFWGFADGLHDALKIDPDWRGDGSINLVNERHRGFMERFIRAELGDDSPLLDKVTPRYPPYGKRILIDNRWYRTLDRDNVELVTDPIRRIVADGVETSDGVVREFDAIICATGFQASKMQAPMTITGRGGVDLHSVWKPDDATAYLGTMVPGFPNFFMLLGPNTGLAHGGNAIFVAECQMRFVMKCLRALIDEGRAAVEVTQEAHDQGVAEIDRLHAGMVWSHPGMDNWYRNKAGRVFAVLPYRLVDFWRMTAELRREDLILSDS